VKRFRIQAHTNISAIWQIYVAVGEQKLALKRKSYSQGVGMSGKSKKFKDLNINIYNMLIVEA
jgi:hypothetical protein